MSSCLTEPTPHNQKNSLKKSNPKSGVYLSYFKFCDRSTGVAFTTILLVQCIMPRKTSMLILSQTWRQKQRFLKRSCCWEVGAVARQSSFPLNLSTQTGFRQGGDSVVKVGLGVKESMCWVLVGLCLWCRSRDYRILIPAVRTIMCDGDVVAHSGSHGEEVRSDRLWQLVT